MATEVEVNATGLDIEPGRYHGHIQAVTLSDPKEYKGDVIQYANVSIALNTDEGKQNLEPGFNVSNGITPRTDLGKLLNRLGFDVNPDEGSFDLEELEGQRIECLVQEDEDGFMNVVKSSIQPRKTEQAQVTQTLDEAGEESEDESGE